MMGEFHSYLFSALILNLISLFFLRSDQRFSYLTQGLNILSASGITIGLLKISEYTYDSSFFLNATDKQILVFASFAFLFSQLYLFANRSSLNSWLSFFTQFSFWGVFALFASKTVLCFFAAYFLIYIIQFTLYISHSQGLLQNSSSFLKKQFLILFALIFALVLYTLGAPFYVAVALLFLITLLLEQNSPISAKTHPDALFIYHFIFKPTLLWALASRFYLLIDKLQIQAHYFWPSFIVIVLALCYFIYISLKKKTLYEHVYHLSHLSYLSVLIALLLPKELINTEILAFSYLSVAISSAALLLILNLKNFSLNFYLEKFITSLFLVFVFSLIGLPFTSGFFYRYFSFQKAQIHAVTYCLLNIFILLLICYESYCISKIIFEKNESLSAKLKISFANKIVLLVAAALTLYGGFWSFFR